MSIEHYRVLKKKIEIESNRYYGLYVLWSPWQMTRFLSPAYNECRVYVCLGLMKVSFSAATKNAGIKADWTF